MLLGEVSLEMFYSFDCFSFDFRFGKGSSLTLNHFCRFPECLPATLPSTDDGAMSLKTAIRMSL
jgi:hypothetical protein